MSQHSIPFPSPGDRKSKRVRCGSCNDFVAVPGGDSSSRGWSVIRRKDPPESPVPCSIPSLGRKTRVADICRHSLADEEVLYGSRWNTWQSSSKVGFPENDPPNGTGMVKFPRTPSNGHNPVHVVVNGLHSTLGGTDDTGFAECLDTNH